MCACFKYKPTHTHRTADLAGGLSSIAAVGGFPLRVDAGHGPMHGARAARRRARAPTASSPLVVRSRTLRVHELHTIYSWIARCRQSLSSVDLMHTMCPSIIHALSITIMLTTKVQVKLKVEIYIRRIRFDAMRED